jgi:hypothetical protein
MMISASRKIAFRALLAFVAALLPAHAEDELHFVTDQASHCSLGTFATGLPPTVQWTGACVNGKAEGPGVAIWQNAAGFRQRTEATFHAGLAEGRGIKQTGDNFRYEAEFHNGRMNGRCVLTKSDLRIDGQCVDDQFNGPVKIVFTDGGHYEGDFKDGKFNGQGIFYRKDGTRFEGEWVNHSLNGKGRAVYANGASYEGDFVNGDMEGQGVYHFADGGVYEGEWHNGIPNGRGVYHGIPNGPFGMRRDFAGTWVNGCFAQAPLTAALFKRRAECGFDD